METFTQVKNTVVEAAKEAKEKVVDFGQGAKDLVLGMADRLTGQAPSPATGLPDALTVLKADHELVNGLFAQIAASESSGPTREGLFGQLKYELETHAIAEEKLFYPAVDQAAHAQKLVSQALADHAKVKQSLAELAAMSMQTSGWLDRIELLRKDVERHVQMEQDELFVLAKQALSEAQLQELGRCITAEKDTATADGTPATNVKPAPSRSPRKRHAAQRATHH